MIIINIMTDVRDKSFPNTFCSVSGGDFVDKNCDGRHGGVEEHQLN